MSVNCVLDHARVVQCRCAANGKMGCKHMNDANSETYKQKK